MKRYAVQSPVALHTCAAFVESLKNQIKISVPRGNAGSFSLFAEELFVSELAIACAPFSGPVNLDRESEAQELEFDDIRQCGHFSDKIALWAKWMFPNCPTFGIEVD
jgi:hypothetical protein